MDLTHEFARCYKEKGEQFLREYLKCVIGDLKKIDTLILQVKALIRNTVSIKFVSNC